MQRDDSDHHTPLLNTRIWKGASNQAVAPDISRPLHATANSYTPYRCMTFQGYTRSGVTVGGKRGELIHLASYM